MSPVSDSLNSVSSSLKNTAVLYGILHVCCVAFHFTGVSDFLLPHCKPVMGASENVGSHLHLDSSVNNSLITEVASDVTSISNKDNRKM